MTKKHHPHSRAERLALEVKYETKKKSPYKVRKHLRETLKERDAKDELKQYSQSN